MLNTESLTLDTASGPVNVLVSQLPGMRASKLLWKIKQIVGPAMLKALGSGEGLMDFQLSSLAEAAELLYARCNEDQFEAITRELFSACHVSGAKGTAPLMTVYDEVFKGGPGLAQLPKVFAKALEVNFGPFLQGLVGIASTFRPASLSKE